MASLNGLNVMTLIPGCGYGDAGCQYIAGLDALGVPVSWNPLIPNSAKQLAKKNSFRDLQPSVRESLQALWRRPLAYDAMLINIPPFYWQNYWRQQLPTLRPYTYIAWEVMKMPEEWLVPLNGYRRVFVPSTFNQQALLEGGVTTAVDVVPHIARPIQPVSDEASWGDVEDDDFVFYTINSWTSRKAMDETIRAYLQAFTGADPVALIIKTDSVNQVAFNAMSKAKRRSAPSHHAMVWLSLAKIIADYPNPAKIHLIAKGISPEEIDQLHSRGDCFISLTHSEGWGLGAFDAALFGNSVIITGWGGQLDYLGEDYPLLVDYQLQPTARSEPDGCFSFGNDIYWAHADRDHASALMRQVVSRPEWTAEIGRQLQSQLKERYAAERVCRRLAELMGYTVTT